MDEGQTMLILKEKGGERILPILMSKRRAVLLKIRKSTPFLWPIPMSVADIGNQLMAKFEVHLKRIVINGITDGTYYCQVVAERDGEEQVVNVCKATDGIEMATVAGCPILIEEELFQAQYLHKIGENSFAININTFSRQMLESALTQAVEAENYEAASRLRDELAKRPPIGNAESAPSENVK